METALLHTNEIIALKVKRINNFINCRFTAPSLSFCPLEKGHTEMETELLHTNEIIVLKLIFVLLTAGLQSSPSATQGHLRASHLFYLIL